MTRSAHDGDGGRAVVSWDTAPVARGRRRRRWPWVAVVALLVLGVAGFLAQSQRGSPTRTVRAADRGSQGTFDVDLRVATVTAVDNDLVFGRHPATTDATLVRPAVRQIEEVIGGYLDGVFVAAPTRFSDGALRDLLQPDAVASATADDLAGLGVLEAAVQAVEPGSATGTAAVLTSDGEEVMVAVRYDARAQVVTADGGTGTLRQRADIVFVPAADGWRAAAAQAELMLPDAAAGGR